MKISDPKFKTAVDHFRLAVKASREHSELVAKSLEKYGDQGPQISGIIRDHFPAKVKDELRLMARNVTLHSEAAHKARPKGVRLSTMRKLSQEVATKYGSGFYGPQATRKNPVKKRRTAKQIAATKKLVAFNKARRGGVMKKKARKKVAKRLAKKAFKIGRLTNPTNEPTLYKRASDFIQKLRWSNKAEAQAAIQMLMDYSKDYGNSPEERTLYKKAAAYIRAWIKDYATDQRGRARNPVAKQKSHLWVLFRCAAGKVQFYNGGWPLSKQWGPRGKAALFRSRGHASASATTAQQSGLKSHVYGAAPENTTIAEIKKHCNYESGKV